jgi:hypothetical protein
VALAYVVASAVWAPLGLLVWYRRPEHPIGPMLALVGFLNLVIIPGFVMGALLVQFEATITPRPWPMLITVALSGAYSHVFLIPILLFPEGRPTNRPKLVLTWLILISCSIATVSGLLAEPLGPVGHPFVSPSVGDTARSIYDFMTQAFGAALVAVVVLQVFDYRRSESTRKAQLKWLIYVLGVYMVATVVSFGVVGVQNFEAGGLVVDATFVALIPAAMAIAILKYRLYEIDRIVSRTVSYTVLVIVIAAVFAIPVILIPSVVAGSSDLVVAGATLAAAGLFNPARRAIQTRVDRRFNRSRYDAAMEIEALAARVNASPSGVAPVEETVGLVSRVLQPSSIGLWVRG